MLEIYTKLVHQHPWVSIIALVGCIGIALVVLVVWKEILNMDFGDNDE